MTAPRTGRPRYWNPTESKLKLIQQRNQGPEIARNTAAALAQGEYLVYLDSDDLFLPFALETFDKVIRHTDSPPLLLGNILFFQDGEPPPQPPPSNTIEIFKFRNYASKTISLSSNSTIIRKSVFDAVGGGRRDSTPQTFHADDTYIQLRAGDYSPFVAIKHPCTSAYRLHGDNTSKNLAATVDAILRLIRLDEARWIWQTKFEQVRLPGRTGFSLCLPGLLAQWTAQIGT